MSDIWDFVCWLHKDWIGRIFFWTWIFNVAVGLAVTVSLVVRHV